MLCGVDVALLHSNFIGYLSLDKSVGFDSSNWNVDRAQLIY